MYIKLWYSFCMIKRFGLLLGLCGLIFSGCAKKAAVAGDDVPQRIVALSPVASEILFAVGAGGQVAAVSQFTDYPAEACELPQVGGFDGKTLSMESILGFKPDLVYLSDVMHNFMIPQLEEYGIKYYLSKSGGIEGVEQEIMDVGKLTGHEAKAREVVDEMKKKIEAAGGDFDRLNQHGQSGQNDINVYWEVWNSPFMSAGSSSFMNDVILAAGGKNIFDDVEEAYPIVSEEAIIRRSPDVIIIPASCGISADDVKARDGWGEISAVVNDKIFIVDDNLYTRAGPRIADVVMELANMIK